MPVDELFGFEGTESLCGRGPAEADGFGDVAGAQSPADGAEDVEDVLRSPWEALCLAGVKAWKGGQDEQLL